MYIIDHRSDTGSLKLSAVGGLVQADNACIDDTIRKASDVQHRCTQSEIQWYHEVSHISPSSASNPDRDVLMLQQQLCQQAETESASTL